MSLREATNRKEKVQVRIRFDFHIRTRPRTVRKDKRRLDAWKHQRRVSYFRFVLLTGFVSYIMPKRTDIKKIMVIGSGPIVIGQAAEFDYAGTQACLALKEEGYSVVLVNSNPATIMTDKEIADKVYIGANYA